MLADGWVAEAGSATPQRDLGLYKTGEIKPIFPRVGNNIFYNTWYIVTAQ